METVYEEQDDYQLKLELVKQWLNTPSKERNEFMPSRSLFEELSARGYDNFDVIISSAEFAIINVHPEKK